MISETKTSAVQVEVCCGLAGVTKVRILISNISNCEFAMLLYYNETLNLFILFVVNIWHANRYST